MFLSVAFWAILLAGLRITVAPPESCGANDEESIQRAAALAVTWMRTNQYADGTFVYLYYPDTDTAPADYNEVRHAGVTMALYQAAGRMQDGGALAAADLALEWMKKNTVYEGDWAALAPNGHYASLGASALMLVGLAERRLATSDPVNDDLMHGLASFIAAMQREDGGFRISYDFETDQPDIVNTSRYYPGESLWALALMQEAFPGEGWDKNARDALQFITTMRDEVENVEFPPLADQWAAYGIGEMVEWGLTDQQIDYARQLAARFGLLVRTEAQREGSWFGHRARGRYSRASGVGTWNEGLAALWRASQADPRLADIAEPTVERLRCVSGILADRQVSVTEAKAFPRPGLAAGAWFRNNETRMDDQQHAFSGLLYTLDAIRGNPTREPQLPGFPRPLN